ncbi:MAG: FecR domain-containing protein [bacterium]|jgi:transmembrane sensor|nr:MAG: hypothetical protein DIU52_01805 [bacterium]
MGNDEFDWSLLARYLSGECDAAEAAAFEAWLDRRPDRRREYELIRLAWERAGAYRFPARAEEALLRVAARAGVGRSVGARRRVLARDPRRRAAFLRLAAVLALAIGPAAFLWIQRQRAGDGREPDVVQEYATKRAQRATLRLPDGSTVVLAPESRVWVANRPGCSRCTVQLEGEALFRVERDPGRRFLVRTHGAETEVLGTTFLVQADRDEPGVTEVVVVEGQVALRPLESEGDTGELRLGRGEAARVVDGRLEVLDSVDVSSRVAWAEGRLEFHRQPFSRVAAELGRWYDVEIEYPAALADVAVTATFGEEPLQAVLEALDQLLDVRHTRDGRRIRFRLDP